MCKRGMIFPISSKKNDATRDTQSKKEGRRQNTMHARTWLLVLAVVAARKTTVVAVATTRRALPKHNYTSCEWKRPPACHESPTFDIQLYWVDSHDDDNTAMEATNKTTNSSRILPFPEDLKGPVQAAADLWSRAIVGTTQTKKKWSSRLCAPLQTEKGALKVRRRDKNKKEFSQAVALACGVHSIDRSTVDNVMEDDNKNKNCSAIPALVLCVHYQPLDENVIASARPIVVNNRGLPILAMILLNSRLQEELDFCDWANSVAHEIAHALGFYFGDGSPNRRYMGRKKSFRGSHAKREWDKLVNSGLKNPAALPPRYPLMEKDASHWSNQCFANEMMLPGYDGLKRKLRSENDRLVLSRLTLAVLEDIGYQVNYRCADASVSIKHQTCTLENHPSGMSHLVSTLRKRLKRILRKVRILRRKTRRRFIRWLRKHSIRVVVLQ